MHSPCSRRHPRLYSIRRPEPSDHSYITSPPSTFSFRLFQPTQPITVIFRYLQQGTRVSLWLYDDVETRIEGKIVGFDEFMNVVVSEAEEVVTDKVKNTKSGKSLDGREAGDRRDLGRILLKGDNITLIQPAA